MSIEDRTRWDEKHRRSSTAGTLTARPSVLSLPPPGARGRVALDLACGRGRHALALRNAGWLVVAMDASGEALRRTREACGTGDGILAVQADADIWPFAPASFDLVVQVDFLDRSLFPAMKESLRPGGLLMLDTFLDQGRPNADGPSRPAFLLAPGELALAFGDLEILGLEETRADSARGCLLARKR